MAHRTIGRYFPFILFLFITFTTATSSASSSPTSGSAQDESLIFNYENYIRVSDLVSLQAPAPLSLALPLPPADAYQSPDQVTSENASAPKPPTSIPAPSRPAGLAHHEEHLFILTHQVFELWFKQMLHDLQSASDIFLIHTTNSSHRAILAPAYRSSDADVERFRLLHSSDGIANLSIATWTSPFLATSNSEELVPKESQEQSATKSYNPDWTLSVGAADIIAKRLLRCEDILRYATGAFRILETMHPSDYLAFREHLGTGSGFQSLQMRHLEIILGMRPPQRIGHTTYRAQFTPSQQQLLLQWENAPSLHDLLVAWLKTIPVPIQFISEFRNRTTTPEDYPFDDPTDPRWAALYIITYRMEYASHPQLAAYARILDALTALEEALILWRSTHPRMVERMIGRRVGTGGSSGVGYLDKTREYRIFNELWWLRTAAIHPMPSLAELVARPLGHDESEGKPEVQRGAIHEAAVLDIV